jgi:hypothetical protein
MGGRKSGEENTLELEQLGHVANAASKVENPLAVPQRDERERLIPASLPRLSLVFVGQTPGCHEVPSTTAAMTRHTFPRGPKLCGPIPIPWRDETASTPPPRRAPRAARNLRRSARGWIAD